MRIFVFLFSALFFNFTFLGEVAFSASEIVDGDSKRCVICYEGINNLGSLLPCGMGCAVLAHKSCALEFYLRRALDLNFNCMHCHQDLQSQITDQINENPTIIQEILLGDPSLLRSLQGAEGLQRFNPELFDHLRTEFIFKIGALARAEAEALAEALARAEARAENLALIKKDLLFDVSRCFHAGSLCIATVFFELDCGQFETRWTVDDSYMAVLMLRLVLYELSECTFLSLNECVPLKAVAHLVPFILPYGLGCPHDYLSMASSALGFYSLGAAPVVNDLANNAVSCFFSALEGTKNAFRRCLCFRREAHQD